MGVSSVLLFVSWKTAGVLAVDSEKRQVSGCGGRGSVLHLEDNLVSPGFHIGKTAFENFLSIHDCFHVEMW